ncbi:galactoside 2-alpha-l-fucosyltransferase [Plakobranchus ocellatus]|uniref:L-Fucosyltransferase n=1 Tax=Plakobranchus ocellatus TaxID=259542 RepID=A0AAV4A5H0_9GAST|nr:galactoside 2-alpha-l-fucosyltransferase [Plakobranchus ocellatus]
MKLMHVFRAQYSPANIRSGSRFYRVFLVCVLTASIVSLIRIFTEFGDFNPKKRFVSECETCWGAINQIITAPVRENMPKPDTSLSTNIVAAKHSLGGQALKLPLGDILMNLDNAGISRRRQYHAHRNLDCDIAIFPSKDRPTKSRYNKESKNNTTTYFFKFSPKGRLGNQMFEFASTIGIAHAQNRAVCLSLSSELLDYFELSGFVKIDWKESADWLEVMEIEWATYDRNLMELPVDDIVIDGYLQSWRYFYNARAEIKKLFTFYPSVLVKAKQLVNSMWDIRRYPPNSTALIGVHVRRGDYLQPDRKRRGFTVAKRSYFLRAFQWMRDALKDKNVLFVVACDDTAWCENYLSGGDVKTSIPAPAEVHLAMLASCDHVIISTGSFGWWAAWLSRGMVVYYKNFPVPDSPIGKGFNKSDYFLHSWVGLE